MSCMFWTDFGGKFEEKVDNAYFSTNLVYEIPQNTSSNIKWSVWGLQNDNDHTCISILEQTLCHSDDNN